MITAARILALAGLRLVDEPDTIKKAWTEFRGKTGGKKYHCPIPDNVKPPLHLFDPNRKH